MPQRCALAFRVSALFSLPVLCSISPGMSPSQLRWLILGAIPILHLHGFLHQYFLKITELPVRRRLCPKSNYLSFGSFGPQYFQPLLEHQAEPDLCALLFFNSHRGKSLVHPAVGQCVELPLLYIGDICLCSVRCNPLLAWQCSHNQELADEVNAYADEGDVPVCSHKMVDYSSH
jgi:hypothetical protein